MSRRTARGQQIPPQEVELLNTLSHEALVKRAHDLYHAGWSLQTIGDSLQPKRPKTTIRSWVTKIDSAANTNTSNQEVIDAPPVPSPKLKTAEEGNQNRRPESSGIKTGDLEIIASLAPLARQYRSRMTTTSAAAVANDRLSAICILQHQSGVSIKELAAAAGVTYRAMYKRIKL